MQVGDVAQHGDDTRPFARIVDHRAKQLEQEVRSFGGVDQQQLTAPALARVERRSRQRRRKKHVVQLHRAPASFADVLGSGEQQLGARVRDDELPFQIGEQDRIGGRIDDVEQQRMLAAKPGVFVEQVFVRHHALQVAPERSRDPADRGGGLENGTHKEQAERRLLAGIADLDGAERRIAEQRRS